MEKQAVIYGIYSLFSILDFSRTGYGGAVRTSQKTDSDPHYIKVINAVCAVMFIRTQKMCVIFYIILYFK